MKHKRIRFLIAGLTITGFIAQTAFAAEFVQPDTTLSSQIGARAINLPTLAVGDTNPQVENSENLNAQIENIRANGFTEEQTELAAKKLLNESFAVQRLFDTQEPATWNFLTGFTIWKQAEKNYCVPAACKAAVNYLTGSSDSQDAIAKELGTTKSGTYFTEAKLYLNRKQKFNPYVSKAANTPLETMKDDFADAINYFHAPVLIDVKLTTQNGWAYNSDGHAMLICGARSDKAVFKVADPYILWVDESASMFYSKGANEIQSAIFTRGIGYIY